MRYNCSIEGHKCCTSMLPKLSSQSIVELFIYDNHPDVRIGTGKCLYRPGYILDIPVNWVCFMGTVLITAIFVAVYFNNSLAWNIWTLLMTKSNFSDFRCWLEICNHQYRRSSDYRTSSVEEQETWTWYIMWHLKKTRITLNGCSWWSLFSKRFVPSLFCSFS